MKLIITEKPSVAQTIAKVLGITQRKDGYLENDEFIISWCVGHLVGLANPKSYNENLSKWSYEQLPIFPTIWQWETIKKTKNQFNILSKLMNDTRVDSLICATDAGREGELIFRLVYHQANCKKPFERLWVSSMEDQSILDAFDQLTPSQNYDALFASALCRSKADWLVGMNATRLFSVLYGQTLNVGRVQSPTLSMLVERVRSIQNFQKEKYFAVHLKTDQFTAVSQKITSEIEAQTIQKACHNQQTIVRTIEAKEKNISPPKLYDLTSLQREANRIFDYTAQQTLDYAQSLYEKKVITYPRTDSKFITDDMNTAVQNLADKVIERFSFSPVISHQPAINLIINNKKVSDHHGLLPTSELFNYDIDTIPSAEKNILLLIIKRLLTATGQKHTVEEVTVFLECGEYPFSVKGKTIKFGGWKEIEAYGTEQFFNLQKKNKELPPLPPLSVEQAFKVQASIATLFSSPPKYFTEDSILSAMENAGNDYDFEDNDEIEKKGIGTPATRAAVIEKLVKSELIERRNKQLLPTTKGKVLISILPEALKSPFLTAEWENKLTKIENGEFSADVFMNDIKNMVEVLVKENHSPKDEYLSLFPSIKESKESIGKCPRCHKKVIESLKAFYCEGDTCTFTMWKNSSFFEKKKKKFTRTIAQKLLSDGKVYVKGLYSANKDKKYDAFIILADTGGKFVNYQLDFSKQK